MLYTCAIYMCIYLWIYIYMHICCYTVKLSLLSIMLSKKKASISIRENTMIVSIRGIDVIETPVWLISHGVMRETSDCCTMKLYYFERVEDVEIESKRKQLQVECSKESSGEIIERMKDIITDKILQVKMVRL